MRMIFKNGREYIQVDNGIIALPKSTTKQHKAIVMMWEDKNARQIRATIGHPSYELQNLRQYCSITPYKRNGETYYTVAAK